MTPEVLVLFYEFLKTLATPAIIMLLLILLAVISGVLVAIKNKQFEWRKLGDFMSMILVKFFGWALFMIFAWVIQYGAASIPVETGITAQAIMAMAQGSYILIVVSLVGQVLGNFKELGLANQTPTIP
jgi:1,4-dihydroxy-2-naphthoate octaprenyltransferase